MSHATYLPAIHTTAGSLCLGRLSVRTVDDQEIGELVGFVLDSHGQHISSLVMEVVTAGETQQVEMPMVSLRLDTTSHALRMVDGDAPRMTTFNEESVPQVEQDDLWIPLVHTAA